MASAQDPDLLDLQYFGFLDPDADPQIEIQGAKYHPTTVKKIALNLKSELIIEYFLISEWFIKK